MTIKKYLFFLIILVSQISCYRKVVYVADTSTSYYRVDKKLKATNATIDSVIAPYKATLDVKMNVYLATNESELVKGKPNSTLTNWFSDVFYEGSKAKSNLPLDFSVSNYGGIRVNALGKGDVTIGKIFELMPFENMLAIATTDSLGVQKLCDRIARYGGWPVSTQLNFEIRDSLANNITIHKLPLSGKRNYMIALPDYVANGGDDCFFLKDYKIEFTSYLIRDLLIEEVKKEGNIKANNEERIKISKNGK